MSIRLCFIGGILAVSMWACDGQADLILPHTWDIFPIEEGAQRVTAVVDTTYNTSGPEEERYFKRETISNEEIDLAGRTIRRLLVDRSDWALGAAYEWKQDRVWSIHKPDSVNGSYFVERNEENKKVLILKFPVYPGIDWNGNLYNQERPQVFRYRRVDTTVTVAAGTFDNCVMVLQRDERGSFIRDAYAYEIYAPGVGLIKKYSRNKVFDGPNGEFNSAESRVYQEELVEMP